MSVKIKAKRNKKNNSGASVSEIYNPLDSGIDLDGKERNRKINAKDCSCPCPKDNEALKAGPYVSFSPI